MFFYCEAAGLLVREHCPLSARAVVLQMEQGTHARLRPRYHVQSKAMTQAAKERGRQTNQSEARAWKSQSVQRCWRCGPFPSSRTRYSVKRSAPRQTCGPASIAQAYAHVLDTRTTGVEAYSVDSLPTSNTVPTRCATLTQDCHRNSFFGFVGAGSERKATANKTSFKHLRRESLGSPGFSCSGLSSADASRVSSLAELVRANQTGSVAK